jgi:hypothetical protein
MARMVVCDNHADPACIWIVSSAVCPDYHPAVYARTPRGALRDSFMQDMLREWLPTLIFLAGAGQLGILIASALVPFQLKWKAELATLSRLHRQMYWIYGAYVVLAIASFGLICLFNADELASGSGLARGLCGYIAIFWGVRLALQWVLDAEAHLSTWWLRLGYRVLTILFASFTFLFGFAALRPH